MDSDVSVNWRDHAACKGMPVGMWFEERGQAQVGRKKALAICRSCEVQAECLEYALQFAPHEQFGIFGGATANERIKFQHNVLLTRKETRHVI